MITYRQLKEIQTYSERLQLLLLKDYQYDSPRSLMSEFYKSWEWRQVREYVIKRDLAQDLGVDGL